MADIGHEGTSRIQGKASDEAGKYFSLKMLKGICAPYAFVGETGSQVF